MRKHKFDHTQLCEISVSVNASRNLLANYICKFKDEICRKKKLQEAHRIVKN